MPELHTYIEEAIKEAEDRQTDSIPIFERHDSVDVLIDLIADKTENSHRDFRVSEDTYKTKIEGVINELDDQDRSLGEFHAKLEEEEEDLRDSLQEYRILFPLNFDHDSAPGFNSRFSIRDLEFSQATGRTWEEFRQKASEESDFDEFLEMLPTQENREDPLYGQYYWEVNYEAGEEDYAVNQIESAVKILLGKIAFASESFRQRQSLRPT